MADNLGTKTRVHTCLAVRRLLLHSEVVATLSTPSDSAQEQQTVSGMYYVRWANEEDQKTGAKAGKAGHGKSGAHDATATKREAQL